MLESGMSKFFTGDSDLDPDETPEAIDNRVRDAITRKLAQTDLSADERTQYEEALKNLDD